MSDEQTIPAQQRFVVDDIAAALGVPADELAIDTNLLDAGLDSVRIMSLVEKWRAAGHDQIDFATLASDPVLGSWLDALS
ncbi:phosphopantetheine-binding protein [Nocardia cyriacigeorgica]|uniref:Phenyloxazoline synthase MbtB n=1 Tax=Nocardia cyriacigeorgica TaxID=135487 RepID=A0A2L2JSC2_9NOCA|nr:phosphopantetheine-binding protein [Nocardia cyriacigeorgica]AVH22721.1 isochorismatase [Nocardia cyriacigeorgica]VFA99037.1 Phenyloxazoline synthase MbtB [Nocardia cyriacigeorgica]